MNGHFPYVKVFTTIHMITATLLSLLLYKLAPSLYPSMGKARANWKAVLKFMVPLGCLFALNLYLSNKALQFCSLSFVQFCKEGNVALMFALACLIGLQTFSWYKARRQNCQKSQLQRGCRLAVSSTHIEIAIKSISKNYNNSLILIINFHDLRTLHRITQEYIQVLFVPSLKSVPSPQIKQWKSQQTRTASSLFIRFVFIRELYDFISQTMWSHLGSVVKSVVKAGSKVGGYVLPWWCFGFFTKGSLGCLSSM